MKPDHISTAAPIPEIAALRAAATRPDTHRLNGNGKPLSALGIHTTAPGQAPTLQPAAGSASRQPITTKVMDTGALLDNLQKVVAIALAVANLRYLLAWRNNKKEIAGQQQQIEQLQQRVSGELGPRENGEKQQQVNHQREGARMAPAGAPRMGEKHNTAGPRQAATSTEPLLMRQEAGMNKASRPAAMQNGAAGTVQKVGMDSVTLYGIIQFATGLALGGVTGAVVTMFRSSKKEKQMNNALIETMKRWVKPSKQPQQKRPNNRQDVSLRTDLHAQPLSGSDRPPLPGQARPGDPATLQPPTRGTDLKERPGERQPSPTLIPPRQRVMAALPEGKSARQRL